MAAQGRETNALREASELITEYVRKTYPAEFPLKPIAAASAPPDSTVAGDAVIGGSVADELAAELAELPSKRKRDTESSSSTPVPLRHSVVCRALGLIWFHGQAGSNIDPCRVIDALMVDLAQTKMHATKFVDRLLPLQRIVRCDTDDVLSAVRELIAPELGEPSGVQRTWCGEVRVRNTEAISRTVVINGLADVMRRRFRVDLVDPSYTVVVEAVMSITGVSVLRDRAFKRFHKYNVRLAAETDAEREARLHEAQAATEKAIAKKAAAAASATATQAESALGYGPSAEAHVVPGPSAEAATPAMASAVPGVAVHAACPAGVDMAAPLAPEGAGP
jgi:tRNA(Ser,Leu) C12 N-acetylase TAN1